MHGEADIHGTVQVGRGFHFRECRALDGVDVCHVDIIGTGWGPLGRLVDTLPTGRRGRTVCLTLCSVIDVKIDSIHGQIFDD